MASPFPGFIAVNKKYLLSGKCEISFDLFIDPDEKKVKEPLLLVGKNTHIRNIKKILAEKKFDSLLIRKKDLKSFYGFVEDSLHIVIDDSKMPLKEKSQIIYSCATNVMKEVFINPRSGKNVNRARGITDNIIKFAFSNDASIPSLLELSSHDYYTFTHCVNVAVFGIGLWQVISPEGSKEELEEFALGCILHDVGKSKIADVVLNKPGRLTGEEFEIIKQHPQFGYDLMQGAISDTALDIILHHHEKFDGKGYPHGLYGGNISDNAKIATIADVYDALTTIRPYSDARDPYKALILMKNKMVGHFEKKKFITFINFLSCQK